MPNLIIGGLTISTDDRDRVHFWGEVFNRDQQTVRWVRVSIRLLNERGRKLAEKTDLVGLEWIVPGGRCPFYIRFEEPPKGWRTYSLTVSGVAHDFDDLGLPQPHLGLVAEKDHYREINRADLRCSIVGLLSNHSLVSATHVKVACTLYGPNGKVVGVLSPYLVQRGLLSSGDEMAFELKFYVLADIVSDYRLEAQGRALLPG